MSNQREAGEMRKEQKRGVVCMPIIRWLRLMEVVMVNSHCQVSFTLPWWSLESLHCYSRPFRANSSFLFWPHLSLLPEPLSFLQLFPSPCCYYWKTSPSVPPLWSFFCFKEGCLHLHFFLLILRFSCLTPPWIVPSSKLWMAAYFTDFHGFNLGFLEFPDTHEKWWFYFSMSLTIKQYLKCKPYERQSHKIRFFLVLFKCFWGVLSECSISAFLLYWDLTEG